MILYSALEWYDLFKTYDQDGNDLLDIKELGNVMRCEGYNPTEEEIQKTMKEADKDGKINVIRSKVTRSPVIMSYLQNHKEN